ncbi:MAG: sigma-70 family RNA polymerase sigma factor [Gemmatimonadota bacterium]|nr:sigma-70 family RNA polymerase sigma factor [Gemmatimonadota bacterium]
MSDPHPSEITTLLQAMAEGQPGAADQLVPMVYDRLRDLAVRAMRRESEGHTLQPTALVHEAFLLLVDQRSTEWKNRTHFYSMAARIMRRVLIDQARMRLAAKRSGGLQVTLNESIHGVDDDPAQRTVDIIAIEEALTRLESLDERPARVVELRFFAGLDVAETATVLNISPASVTRDWVFARAFLKRELLLAEGEA